MKKKLTITTVIGQELYLWYKLNGAGFTAPFCYLLYLSTTLCIAIQNLLICVNELSSGSPSRIRIVLLISLGITTRPKSSILLTFPLAVPDSALTPIVAQSSTAALPYARFFSHRERSRRHLLLSYINLL